MSLTFSKNCTLVTQPTVLQGHRFHPLRMLQELQHPAMRSVAVRFLRDLPRRPSLGRAGLGVHAEVQENAKHGDICRLGGHVDGIHALEANLSWDLTWHNWNYDGLYIYDM